MKLTLNHVVLDRNDKKIPVVVTPVKAMRLNCKTCMGHDDELIRECKSEKCPSHPYRMGKRPKYLVHTIQRTRDTMDTVKLPPLKAIRYMCKQCVDWSYTEIENCSDKTCALHPYRLGKTPNDNI